MIILDTNVLSALMRNVPDVQVVAWLDRQPRASIWTTAVTVLEVHLGLEVMATGKRKSVLSEEFDRLLNQIDHRVAAFDEEAGRQAANLAAARRTKGRVIELRDTMIAGIVLAHHASLATRNVAHFSDISATIVNPWAA
jgi:predicted nucleic acid-binding protein